MLQKVALNIYVNHIWVLQGEWRREPWPVRAYKQLDGYEPAADCGEAGDASALCAKLRTTMTGDGSLDDLASLAPRDLAQGVVLGKLPPSLQVGSFCTTIMHLLAFDAV